MDNKDRIISELTLERDELRKKFSVLLQYAYDLDVRLQGHIYQGGLSMGFYIDGSVSTTVNVRASASTSAAVVDKLYMGERFKGSSFVTDSSNNRWIKLTELRGVPVTKDMYVASWVVNFEEKIVDVPGEKVGVPTRIETVEHFEDGSTRTTVWTNPVVFD